MHTHLSFVRDTYQQLPESDWLRFGVLLLVLLTLLWVTRLVSRVNRYVLFVAFVFGTLGLMATWVHNRNEPSFLTPVVDIVAPWFPTKVRTFEV
jgi:hypothetical protein